MNDAFDALALAVHDHSAIFRGDTTLYSKDAERIANGQRELAKHIAALASFMRDGGAVDGFKRETMHFHGSSSHGLPVELAIAFGGDILTGQQCWDMVLHWRNMPPAPWPGNGIVAGSQGDALASVFRHWRTEADHDFRASRDAVNSQVALAGGFCSGSHFIQLSGAVESATGGMLDKARALPIAPDAFNLVKANAAALFDALALEISPNDIDPARRYPDCHTNGVAEKFISEARQRVMAVVDGWELELRASAENSAAQAQPPKKSVLQSSRVPDGKLKAWLEALGTKADAMNQAEILRAAKTAFPEHQVTRDQIRALTPGRKRGKKAKTV